MNDCTRIQTLRPFFAAVLVVVAGCAHTPTTGPSPSEPRAPGAPEIQGPPVPERVFGPDQRQERKVVLFLGPGLPSGLGSAGVIRALHESKVEVAAIVGMEMGALVGAAYAATGTVNGMDFRLLQFKPDWVTPPSGLGAMFSSGGATQARLREGMRRLFGATDLAKTKTPMWVLVSRGERTEVVRSGEIAPALVASFSHRELGATGGEGESPSSWGTAHELLRQQGIEYPAVWVVAKLPPEWPMGAARRAAESATAGLRQEDLLIELDPGQPWDFSRRSEIIYQAKKKSRAAITAWSAERGWEGPSQ
jgi:hypothetical protein